MEYKKLVEDDDQLVWDTVLKGDKPTTRITTEGVWKTKQPKDSLEPLVRYYSMDNREKELGTYALAVHNGEKWEFLAPRFVDKKTAVRMVPGLHCVYARVAVVQYWGKGKEPKPAEPVEYIDDMEGMEV